MLTNYGKTMITLVNALILSVLIETVIFGAVAAFGLLIIVSSYENASWFVMIFGTVFEMVVGAAYYEAVKMEYEDFISGKNRAKELEEMVEK